MTLLKKFNPINFLLIEDIAWDWINQKLYWTDRVNDTIKVYDPIRNIQKILVYTGAGSQPRAIIVDPSTRYVCMYSVIIFESIICIVTVI